MFKRNKKTKLNRTMFDKSHERKMSLKFGGLYPCFVEEIVPGDTINLNTELMLRLAPMTAPVMHRIETYIHFFFVPNRLIWSDWEDFITGNEELEVPMWTNYHTQLLQKGKLADYLGLPIADTVANDPDFEISKLPFYAYNLIYNEYYRDEDLQEEVALGNYEILRRAWDKDYFTSARPWAQKGDVPNLPITAGLNEITYRNPANVVGGELQVPHTGQISAFGGDVKDGATSENGDLIIQNIDNITTGVSINDIRTTAAIQQFLEKKARGGSRYAEFLLSIFGVKSQDSRLQRPEYLGGGKQPIRISEVLNTSDTANAPQGNMAGHGIGVGQTNHVKKFFTEHGYVMGIVSVVPKPAYMNGIDRMFTRKDIYDFYFPQFANLGEQEVQQREVYYDPTQGEEVNNATFGYQSRYAEMKYKADSVHGDFRDDLRQWHLSRRFDNITPPALNAEFIKCNPDVSELFAAGDTADYCWLHMYHNYKAVRPMPYFGTPGLTKI